MTSQHGDPAIGSLLLHILSQVSRCGQWCNIVRGVVKGVARVSIIFVCCVCVCVGWCVGVLVLVRMYVVSEVSDILGKRLEVYGGGYRVAWKNESYDNFRLFTKQ